MDQDVPERRKIRIRALRVPTPTRPQSRATLGSTDFGLDEDGTPPPALSAQFEDAGEGGEPRAVHESFGESGHDFTPS